MRSQRADWNGKWNDISTIDNPSKWWQEQSCSRNPGLARVFGGVARGDTNSRSLGRSEGGAVDARTVTVLPAGSPTAPGIPTKTNPLDHSAPAQPHRSGRTAPGHTVINTAGQQLHPSTLTASTSSTTNQPLLHFSSGLSLSDSPTLSTTTLLPSFLDVHLAFLLQITFSLFVFEKWIRSRR